MPGLVECDLKRPKDSAVLGRRLLVRLCRLRLRRPAPAPEEFHRLGHNLAAGVWGQIGRGPLLHEAAHHDSADFSAGVRFVGDQLEQGEAHFVRRVVTEQDSLDRKSVV